MSTTMLYKHPGLHDIHGGKFDYLIVNDEDIEAAINDGWALTTDEAKALTEEAERLIAERAAPEPQADSEDKPRRGRPPKARE